MDKQTLKSTIIELRNKSKTFSQISKILYDDYGVSMTRQAICSMYNRIVSDKTVNRNTDNILMTNNILNLKALGYNNKQIKEKLETLGYDMMICDIDNIIVENDKQLSDIRESQISKIMVNITKNNNIAIIRYSLQYKGFDITDAQFNKLLKHAVNSLIKKEVTSVLSRVYSLSGNMQLVKGIAKEHNFNISSRSIQKDGNKHNPL